MGPWTAGSHQRLSLGRGSSAYRVECSVDSSKTGETREEATVAVEARNTEPGPGGGVGMERSGDIRTAWLLVIDCG